jgi:hypothetical protein
MSRHRWREPGEREVGVDDCGRVGPALYRGGNFLAAHQVDGSQKLLLRGIMWPLKARGMT